MGDNPDVQWAFAPSPRYPPPASYQPRGTGALGPKRRKAQPSCASWVATGTPERKKGCGRGGSLLHPRKDHGSRDGWEASGKKPQTHDLLFWAGGIPGVRRCTAFWAPDLLRLGPQEHRWTFHRPKSKARDSLKIKLNLDSFTQDKCNLFLKNVKNHLLVLIYAQPKNIPQHFQKRVGKRGGRKPRIKSICYFLNWHFFKNWKTKTISNRDFTRFVYYIYTM